ncbi:hypothetical protein [Elizabethkingia anophelis]|uniref:hypothetical protein n=1 Tax=Elizabethkingia anophelis TaxID=1117645 RepID=UPI0038916CC5
MSNKTALQELQDKISNLEKLSSNISPDYPNDVRYLTGYKDALNSVRKIIDESNILEKEKQQIMEAYHNGQVIVFNLLKKAFPNYKFPLTQDEVDKIECGLDVNEDAEDYFNSKYGNPQGDPETKQ